MNIISIIALSLLGLVMLWLAVYVLTGYICYKTVFSPKRKVRKVKEKIEEGLECEQDKFNWWEHRKFETITIESPDALKLCGHFLAAEGTKLVILVHGYGSSYVEMYHYARMFEKRGYNILAVECRAHGASEGDMIGMGWLDRLDLLAWIECMLLRNPNFRIVLFGVSMGGATVCMTLGEKLPGNVICAISDCAFDNVYRQVSYLKSQTLHMTAKPLMKVFQSYMLKAHNYDMKAADGVKQLKKSQVPVMFIHGESDKFVPTEMVYRLAEAVPENRREVYIVPEAAHTESFVTNPKEYERRVEKLLSKYGM